MNLKTFTHAIKQFYELHVWMDENISHAIYGLAHEILVLMAYDGLR